MRKTLAIIGAGRVGRALGRALSERGWRIGAVVTRSRATARSAVRAIGAGMLLAGVGAGFIGTDRRWKRLQPARVVLGLSIAARNLFGADVILIAVPDRAIESVARKLAVVAAGLPRQNLQARGGVKPPLRGTIVLHTSGSLSHAVLAPLRKQGAAIGAMHPMQTFGRGARTRLDGVVFGLDGDARALRMARRIVRSLGGIPVKVKPQRKVIYHLAGAFAAPHLLAVLETGVRILMHAGYSRRQATHALCFMAQQNIANLERYGSRKAWTGPLPRGDWGTVEKHLAALRGFPREYQQAYAAIARLAARTLARNPQEMLRELDRKVPGFRF
jgi:predicted short-subunit dehydrogenase-like oxidoreductase (DUF2520 family)